MYEHREILFLEERSYAGYSLSERRNRYRWVIHGRIDNSDLLEKRVTWAPDGSTGQKSRQAMFKWK